MKRRQSSISRLAARYNKLCEKLRAALDKGDAPTNATAPLPINTKQLFSLDIDDEIWNDAGLSGNDGGEAPLWMSDIKVRDGIIALLNFRRCCEAFIRLKVELTNLHDWFVCEWNALQTALSTACASLYFVYLFYWLTSH